MLEKNLKKGRIIVLISDGECQEGTTWESLLIASKHKLDNLIIIVDYNKLQALSALKDALPLNNLVKKFKSFNCNCVSIKNGHSFQSIISGMRKIKKGKPNIIVINNYKGKGIKEFENDTVWHARQLTIDDIEIGRKKIKIMRRRFGELICKLADKDKKIVLLVGDIGYGIFDRFRKKHSDRFFNLGICEQSLIGTASGMSLEGLKPWVYTITPFLIERPFEQIKLDINQQKANVKLVGFG